MKINLRYRKILAVLIVVTAILIGFYGLLGRGVFKTSNLKEYKIKVLNGSGIPGSADTARNLLLKEGFENVDIGNASSFDNEKTVVNCKRSTPSPICVLAEDKIGEYYSIAKSEKYLTAESEYDLEIIVGQEFKSGSEKTENETIIKDGVYNNEKYGFMFEYPEDMFPEQFIFSSNSEQAIFHEDFKIDPDSLGTTSEGIQLSVIVSNNPSMLEFFDQKATGDVDEFFERNINKEGIPGYITRTFLYHDGEKTNITSAFTVHFKKDEQVITITARYSQWPISREIELRAIIDQILESIEFYNSNTTS